MSAAAVNEINLERVFLTAGEDASWYQKNGMDDRLLNVAEPLAQLETARATGARVLLLAVDSQGGSVAGGLALYRALQDFRAEGGKVVVYIGRLATSTASWLILASDYTVIHRKALVGIHGGVALRDGRQVTGRRDEAERLSEIKRAIYLNGTTVPVGELMEWIGPAHEGATSGHMLDAGQACCYAFADAIGSKAQAQRAAEDLAAGKVVRSVRNENIAERTPPSSLAWPAPPAFHDALLARRIVRGPEIGVEDATASISWQPYWSDAGGTSLRKIGDAVFLNLSAISTALAGSGVAVLPVGFRPAVSTYPTAVGITTGGTTERIYVTSAGQVTVSGTPGATQHDTSLVFPAAG